MTEGTVHLGACPKYRGPTFGLYTEAGRRENGGLGYLENLRKPQVLHVAH